MKSTRFLTLCMATMMVAAMPFKGFAQNATETIEEAKQTVEQAKEIVKEAKATAEAAKQEAKDAIDKTKAGSKPVAVVKTDDLKVNGRPATAKEKEVAKAMTKQGAKMASKGAKMALKAVTNPQEAERLSEEIEAMGEEMERLGDSLETLAEDTTFFYEGEDSDDVIVTQEDIDDVFEDWTDEDGEFPFKWMETWWGKIIGGSMGIIGIIFAILVVIFVIVLLFAIFTAPVWILALIIWLIVRSGQKTTPTTNSIGAQDPQGGAQQAQGVGAQPNGASSNFSSSATTGAPATSSLYPDENAELWKSGIMWSCIGVGIAILFWASDMGGLWGIGALVACIGVAKLVIATTSKNRQQGGGAPQQDSYTTGFGNEENKPQQETPASTDAKTDYNKSEN